METGGAQVLAVSLLNELCDSQDVSLIIINNKFNKSLLKQLNKKIKIFYINRKEGNRNPLPFIKLNLLLRKLKPDIIHCHEPKVAQIVKTKTAKLLHTIHDVGLCTTLYHLYDKLVAISDAVYNDVISKSHLPLSKVYNGISFESFGRRKDYGLKHKESIRFVQVSRLVHEKKGQDVLLHALHYMKSKFNFSDFSMDFIGSGQSRDYLEKLTCELGLNDKVHFLGERDRDWLFSNLAGYHLLIQPSRSEGFGLTILEGFAAGLPVLASEIQGPGEIISQANGGFLFKNGDSVSCAEQLYHIFEMYCTRQINDLMDKTFDLMQRRYSIKSCAKQYLHEYALLTAF